ncbi:hypothetical protein HDU99_007233 [Rhizoclosmatium hyalinum]|nr:hypothetical protein HDU99_007233 [Rhizoclosmatium hyalinum]
MLPNIFLLESFTRIKQLCVDTKCKEPFVMYTDEERFLQHAEQLQLHKNLETLNLDCRMINSLDWIHQLTLLRHLDLTGTNLPDLPKSLTLLENLEALYLSYAQEIEDFDLVGTLVWLRELRLDNTQVDDLQFIKGMTNLEKLCVWCTSISDLFPIAHLTKLKSLDIGDTQVTSLEPLEGLTGLVKLDITKNRVHHLNSLSKLENLEVLILNETNFDGDLKVLSQLKNLKTLSVANTSVNDLSPLAGLSKLNALNILGTDVQSFSPLQSLEFLDKLCFENEKVNGCELLKCWPFEPILQNGNNYNLFVMHHD